MLYYRFRPFNEFSLKELMYNEMYFASTEESNDPFDSKTFYTFNKDIEKWVDFILLALSNTNPRPAISGEQLKELTEFYCAKCPLTFDELCEVNLLNNYPIKTNEDRILVDILSRRMPQIAKIYKPSQRYFVSFSKEPNEPLMWSHYANKHYGYCLIFRSINGSIKQLEFKKKKQIRRKTPNSFAEEMSYSFPDEFKFIDIEYVDKVIPSDAFLHMPVTISGEAKNDSHRQEIRNEQEKHYAQKGKNWSYEKEARLILSPPPSWIFGDNIEYTNQERLLYFDTSHLVGIIYGAKLSENDKKRIQQIISDKENWELYYVNRKNIHFDFVEFEAKLSQNQREVEIEPIAINTYKRLEKSHKDFDRLYTDWQHGWGSERDQNSSRRIQVS